MNNGVGTVAMELIEIIADEFGADARVTVAGIVCEVVQDGTFQIIARFTDERDWIQAALLGQGLQAIEDAHAEEDGD